MASRFQRMQQVFAAARAFHAAMARYARTFATREDLDRAAQEVVGTSFLYHVALEACLRHAEPDELVAAHARLLRLRRLVEVTHQRYDAARKLARRTRLGQDLTLV